MTCPQHPKYGVLRRPRCQCNTCWDLYYTSILIGYSPTELTEEEFATVQQKLRKLFLAAHARTH